MPIYAYRCNDCGHAKDVLQKISDPVLTTCPACGAEAFQKQITAAGFQLKGSGWYVTDFRGGSGGTSAPAVAGGAATASAAAGDSSASSASDSSSSSSDGGSAAAGGCGTSCACH